MNEEKPAEVVECAGLPARSKEDIWYLFVKILLAGMPWPAGEIFASLSNPPLQRRRDVWLSELAGRLADLESRGSVDFKRLAENEEFVDVLLAASQAAIRTSRQEKLTALANAVENAALVGREYPLMTAFVSLVDKYTPWHLVVLRLLSEHGLEWTESHGWVSEVIIERTKAATKHSVSRGPMERITRKILDSLPMVPEELVPMIWSDLNSDGLIRRVEVRRNEPQKDVDTHVAKVTALGEGFLRFIERAKEAT